MSDIKASISLSSHRAAVRERFANYKPFNDLVSSLQSHERSEQRLSGLAGSSSALLLEALRAATGRPILFVAGSSETAADLYDDLRGLLSENSLGHFPSRQILPFDFRAPVGEVMGRRISTLSDMMAGRAGVVVCPIRALIEPTITKSFLESSRIDLAPGEEIDLDDLVMRLVKLGFRRVGAVEEIGDFAVRGGLIDFFSPGHDAPVRVELFGDEVDTIREFDVASQRTRQKIKHVSVLPRREVPITQQSLEEHLNDLPQDDAEYIRSRYLNDPELPGLEWLSVMFGLEQGALSDYLTDDWIVVFDSRGNLESVAEDIVTEAVTLYERLHQQFLSFRNPQAYYHDPSTLFNELAASHDTIDRLPFRGGKPGIIDFACKPHPSFGSRLDLVGKALAEFEAQGFSYYIATDTAGQKDRLTELINEKSGVDFDPVIEVADLKGGFVCDAGRFAVLTDHEIFSRYHRRTRKKKFKEGVAISDYSSLNRGDYVVHTEYGIARYRGLETLEVDSRKRDCLLLLYANEDKLYVPIEEFNRVSKYAGKEGVPPLTSLGGPQWDKLKEKSKKAIEEMAADLIKLYAERKAGIGYSFGEDTVWLKQLEASFPYEETRDQARAINDVKRDMARDEPMDRLICGDVGFGKTEVAMRAAFKAIEKGKQVALLVPTTVLAQQHYQTFADRFADFPVKVAMLSRFRTKKQQLETLEDLAGGKVDLVIGTHRLFSKDVLFSDLGLLIVDEEHRFGVRHKEKLRQLKATVDTISMTATPIPRTLQMSLMGARDMSLITTSPKDRLPILTEIVEFDPAQIAAAILREMDRGGQVFFVHNRVQTIDAMYRFLKKVVPQAEIGIAHGQMHERSLEGVMLAFLNRRFDVLLCTSIIESGLDIPAANTIIINRADRFGLAQLYQLRGRVGRSDRRAYAYLLTPPTRLMRADAIKRLRAIEAHSDLGSGFALAMRDLEIRGAGTILGARQSGYMEEIGFDLYNKLLEEAVARQRGHKIQRLPETKLELDYEMVLPPEYVSDRHHKVDIYRRLSDAKNVDDVETLREEVTDRFGRMPRPSVDLFDATVVKVRAAMLDVEKVTMRNGRVKLLFDQKRTLQRREVEAMSRATTCPMEFSFTPRTVIAFDLGQVKTDDRLKHLAQILGTA